MPATKRFEDRKMLQPKPEPPPPFSRLEDFAESQVISQKYCLPEPLAKQFKNEAAVDTFLCQAILSLINDSRGVARIEEEKPREEWYTKYHHRSLNKAPILDRENFGGTVEHCVKVMSTISRKRIPLKKVMNVVEMEAPSTISQQCNTFMIPARLWNEFSRLCDYFQLTSYDGLWQAVERKLDKACAFPHRDNPNAELVKIMEKPSTDMDRKEFLHNRMVQAQELRRKKNSEEVM